MVYLLLLSTILILLFVTSQKIFSSLFYFLLKVLRSKKVSITLLSFFFFPGVVIHELSHALTAGILQVRVGDMEFSPVLHEDRLKMGSVRIAQTDPFRRFLIGVAPLVIGSGVLTLILYYFTQWVSFETLLDSTKNLIIFILSLYSVFVITNTMFSSKKDMEGAFGLGIFLVFLLTVIFVAGRGDWIIEGLNHLLQNERVQKIIREMVLLLSIPLTTNILFVSVVFLLRKET